MRDSMDRGFVNRGFVTSEQWTVLRRAWLHSAAEMNVGPVVFIRNMQSPWTKPNTFTYI